VCAPVCVHASAASLGNESDLTSVKPLFVIFTEVLSKASFDDTATRAGRCRHRKQEAGSRKGRACVQACVSEHVKRQHHAC
jgi:hypothetical protein